MHSLTSEEIQKILENHQEYLTTVDNTLRADLAGSILIGANLAGANLFMADLEGADLFAADLREANLFMADLEGADLRHANLSGADLREANLRETNLAGANLRETNLAGANLSRADLSHTEVIGFSLGRHFGFAHFGEQYEEGSYVRIGCEGRSLRYWLNNYKDIGLMNGYPDTYIASHGLQLKLIEKLQKIWSQK